MRVWKDVHQEHGDSINVATRVCTPAVVVRQLHVAGVGVVRRVEAQRVVGDNIVNTRFIPSAQQLDTAEPLAMQQRSEASSFCCAFDCAGFRGML